MTQDNKIRIVFFGTPSFVIPVLQTLLDNFVVRGVVSTPDVPTGRKKILTPTPVKQFALDHTIQTFSLEDLANDKRLKTTDQPDLFVTAAYGNLIPKSVLTIPKFGSLNIHPSLLPIYRGPSPIQSAILNGDKETGVSIIEMDEELDHGPILAQEKIKLQGDETFVSLHELLFQKAAGMLPKIIHQWTNKKITPTPQDESLVVWCKKISKDDGYFDIENPPAKEKLNNMIRAYYPWPTAWTKWQLAHGKLQIVKFLPERKIQLEGGKPMTIKDFLNGYPEMKDNMDKLI